LRACGTILNDRTNLHFLRIAEHLTCANTQFMNLLHKITARYTEAWDDSVSGQAAALKKCESAPKRVPTSDGPQLLDTLNEILFRVGYRSAPM
jgi:hypothetical protein